MSAKRWAISAILGVGAGAIWATGYSDWGTSWVSRLSPAAATFVLLAPLGALTVCALALDWWELPAALVYGAIVIVLGAAGIVRDQKLFGCTCCVGQPWTGLVLQSLGLVAICCGGPLAAAWGIGRLLRRSVRKRISGRAEPRPG